MAICIDTLEWKSTSQNILATALICINIHLKWGEFDEAYEFETEFADKIIYCYNIALILFLKYFQCFTMSHKMTKRQR